MSIALWINFIPIYGNTEINKGDSIMKLVFNFLHEDKNYLQSYDAQVYAKGGSYVKKKNILFRAAPEELFLEKTKENHFTESFVDIHYEAPNHFSQKIIAVNGTHLEAKKLQERVMQLLNINVYSPSAFVGQTWLPEREEAYKYYSFEYLGITDSLPYALHQFKILPKHQSQKLVSGYLTVCDSIWKIIGIDIKGKIDSYNFEIETKYTISENRLPLPTEMIISLDVNVLGNALSHYYYSSYNYSNISTSPSKEKYQLDNKYDLTQYLDIQSDSIPVIIESSRFWNAYRPIPLGSLEKTAYQKNPINEADTTSFLFFDSRFMESSQGLFSNRRFNTHGFQFSYSGLLNPLQLSYSKGDGLSYWQQFKVRKRLPKDQELLFEPKIGFVFKHKEFYFASPVSWLFDPRSFGKVTLSFGNRSRSYSSQFIDKINEQMPDSVNFKDFNLKYYKHYYVSLRGSYEIANGLLIQAGIDYDWYNPVKEKKKNSDDSNPPPPDDGDLDDDISDLINDRYRVFAPSIEISWTPGQYYRFNGKRKEYVSSRFPTMSLCYARGINGIFNSNSDFERIEGGVQQKIKLGLMSSFQYYVGAGRFTKANSEYFADFEFFARYYYPKSWKDPIGGVFHLLDRNWYNASTEYIQGHFMYESLFSLLKIFPGLSKEILNERIYLSQLYMPMRPCYTELGYSIGNYIGNLGFFVSLNKGKYESFGVRAAFDLK